MINIKGRKNESKLNTYKEEYLMMKKVHTRATYNNINVHTLNKHLKCMEQNLRETKGGE